MLVKLQKNRKEYPKELKLMEQDISNDKKIEVVSDN
jgi:hypothetical protein